MTEDTDVLEKDAAQDGKDTGKGADTEANAGADDAEGGADKNAAGGDDKANTSVLGKDADADDDAGKDAGDKSDKADDDFQWPDDWRERLAAGDEDIAKIINRYGSPRAVAKALKDAKDTIRSGKLKRDMPDASDEKAMAEWRKEQGIPEEPSGYELPDTVKKRMTDDDKPMLASFTEYMHAKGANQDEVARATEWYFDATEKMAEEQASSDLQASEACEDALRKDWAHGEYKANLTLGKRFMESIPDIGASWTEARLPDGRRLGDIPGFVAWAADMGRDQFGDATFANGDSDRKHTARKEEIEKVMSSDIDRYYADGMDAEYAKILAREQKRRG